MPWAMLRKSLSLAHSCNLVRGRPIQTWDPVYIIFHGIPCGLYKHQLLQLTTSASSCQLKYERDAEDFYTNKHDFIFQLQYSQIGLQLTMPSFPDDCLPPEGNYNSRAALLQAINAWAAPKGYAFVTGRSAKESSGKLTITYSCDRFSRPPSIPKERQRKTTTRGTGCLFSIYAK